MKNPAAPIPTFRSLSRVIGLVSVICLAFPPGVNAQPPNRPRPTASVETAIRQHAALSNIQPYTGQPIGDRANPSPGNKTDGVGYYMTGTRPNSCFYYVARTGKVYADWGPIREKYVQAGYEFGALGWPSDDEYLLPDGSGFFQRFDHAWIYWCPRYGACIVKGMIFDQWARNNWERGVFGYPAGDEIPYPNSQAELNDRTKKNAYLSYQHFDNGTMYYLYDKVAQKYTVLTQIKNPNLNPSRPH